MRVDIRACECADPGCPACTGKCKRPSVLTLWRVDMADRSGVRVCEACGEDCMESGVFTSERPAVQP